MKTIYKQTLIISDIQILYLPVDMKVLSVKNQNDNICFWYEVDMDAMEETKAYEFYIVGTGNPMPDNIEECKFLDTVIIDPFVWHVYMRG